MPSIFLHKQFIECWQGLALVERDSVQRLVMMLKSGHITAGMRPHKVGPFLSLSPNMDLRIIAVNQGDSITLVHVGHHDAAYRWSQQRGILITDIGMTELINVRDFGQLKAEADGYSLPIPLQDVLNIENEDLFLQAILDMSPEWQEWLFSAYLKEPALPAPPTSSSLVFCPNNDDELTKALSLDITSWQLFLHPNQREVVGDLENTSIAVTGGPGIGKTVVLLNRILLHAPKGKETDLAVLLTYSARLAGYLYDRLKGEKSSRHFRILPLYFLGGKLPTNDYEASVFKKYKLEIVDGVLFLKYSNSNSRRVRELLVDELQDAPPEALQALTTLISSGSTRVVLAADIDQSIFRANRENVAAIITSCSKHYSLDYCYRSTRQILETAINWLSIFDQSPVNNRIFGLSGPRVRFVEVKDLSQQIEVSAEVMRDLAHRYDPSSLALIYCQYFNPSFKGPSKEEEALKKHPELRHYYCFASTTKGKEYYAGMVFISNTFLAKAMGKKATQLRINTLYVALTRFRNEVTVVYPEGCTIASNLHQLS